MENKHLISHFKIFATGNKVSFKSNETIAREVRKALMVDLSFIQDIKLYMGQHPTIKTTIYYKFLPTTSTLLEVGSVRAILENELNHLNPIN